MKRRRRIRFSMLVTSLLLAAVGCSTQPLGHTTKPSCCATNLEFAAVTDKSLYQLDSTWTTDASRTIRLRSLQGRVQVVAMFFASCQYACPIIVHNVKRIEAALPRNALAQVGFTLVTIDRERDVPEALRAYREREHLATGRWMLLRGSADDTLELAALLGVKYKRETNGQFAHSNLITVLNGEGEIIHQQIGLNQDIGETVKAIEHAVRQIPTRQTSTKSNR